MLWEYWGGEILRGGGACYASLIDEGFSKEILMTTNQSPNTGTQGGANDKPVDPAIQPKKNDQPATSPDSATPGKASGATSGSSSGNR